MSKIFKSYSGVNAAKVAKSTNNCGDAYAESGSSFRISILAWALLFEAVLTQYKRLLLLLLPNNYGVHNYRSRQTDIELSNDYPKRKCRFLLHQRVWMHEISNKVSFRFYQSSSDLIFVWLALVPAVPHMLARAIILLNAESIFLAYFHKLCGLSHFRRNS